MKHCDEKATVSQSRDISTLFTPKTIADLTRVFLAMANMIPSAGRKLLTQNAARDSEADEKTRRRFARYAGFWRRFRSPATYRPAFNAVSSWLTSSVWDDSFSHSLQSRSTSAFDSRYSRPNSAIRSGSS